MKTLVDLPILFQVSEAYLLLLFIHLHFLQMEIDLAGQILVLDEAHNIEDCARESASYTLDLHSLQASRDELDGMVSSNIRRSKHEPLRDFCYVLIKSVHE